MLKAMSHSCRVLVMERIHHLLHESGSGRGGEGLAGECGLMMIDISYVVHMIIILLYTAKVNKIA